MSKKVIPAKQEIITEGTTGDCMYIIESGEVQVFKVCQIALAHYYFEASRNFLYKKKSKWNLESNVLARF